MRRLLVILGILLIALGVVSAIQTYAPKFLSTVTFPIAQSVQPVKVVSEESVTIGDVKKIGPSVVTVVGQSTSSSQGQSFDLGPFSIFGIQPPSQNATPQPQTVGSGFIVDANGLIVTNKHVVSDTTETYQVITANNKKYDVKQVYRDPLNDIAILKIDPAQNAGQKLTSVAMGDSSRLQVGQFVVAIGTALGEFRNTVTTGVISGLGRGIQAGDPYQGYVENLNNVIQTSAAINPGNSGGPLVDSTGEVIGINTAVAQGGQNIGFALPINVVKDSLNNFNQTGAFNRPYMGVAYKTITKDVALLNNVPEGAYVQEVVSGSPADKAGIQVGDIIVKLDGTRVGQGEDELATLISKKKVGQTITVSIWRSGGTQDLSVTLITAPNQ